MRGENLDHIVKQHYQQKALSREALSRMEVMAESMSENRLSEKNVSFWQERWRMQRNLSLAASLVIALLLAPFLWQSEDTLLESVAQEVALNHTKQLSSDYVVNGYQNLAALMKKLDFVPISPTRLLQRGYQVSGARYCSIQGRIAAQIKLITESGDELTLYQTRLNDKLSLLNEHHYIVNNVQVHTWQEGGVFLSLAQNVN